MNDVVRDGWHVACRSDELADYPIGRMVGDLAVVLFRDAEGRAAALHDRCPHGLGPLSTGHVSGDVIVCAYHGLRVNRHGACVDSRLAPEAREAAKLESYAVEEREGLLWVRIGS
jgi:vanillate O-demethylase monooxygenase subunit